jgi:hypothetical protein
MKVYVLHDDHHNEPMLETYDSEADALKCIATCEGVHEKEIWEPMFNDADEDEYSGEYWGSDHWTVITEEIASARAKYWASVAEAIAKDEKAPL